MEVGVQDQVCYLHCPHSRVFTLVFIVGVFGFQGQPRRMHVLARAGPPNLLVPGDNAMFPFLLARLLADHKWSAELYPLQLPGSQVEWL